MKTKKLLIVGGVAGGASAAARARRLDEKAEIVLFERGPDISFANCGLPYHIGGVIAERSRLLVSSPETFRTRFNVDVRTMTEVVSIDAKRKEVTARDLRTGKEYRETYDALILSPGAAPVRPPIPGIKNPKVLTLRNLEDMDRILEAIRDKGHAVVIGGGYIGLEMAEALRERNLKVTLVELAPQVMGPADPEMVSVLHRELKLHGVDLRLNTSITEFRSEGDGLTLLLHSGEKLACDVAILAIGVKPETALAAKAGLDIGTTGGIKANDSMLSSNANIFVIGDAVEIKDFSTHKPALIPLAGPANRQGRIAADNALGRNSHYKSTQGTAICKVFNMAIGMTGLSEKTAKRAGIAYEKIYIHPASHATYYPGSHPITLKLLFDPSSGKVLGAQAVGADGVDKRIDVLAVAIRAGLTVYDLEELELSYAPPFGSAKDPVNYAGFVAANILRKDVAIFHTEEALKLAPNQKLLDVRNPDEVELGTIAGAKNIPLGELRARLSELTTSREYMVFCQAGLRGYLACRILMQNGFACRNLTGGYKTFLMATAQESESIPENEQTSDDAGERAIALDDRSERHIKIAKRVDASGLQCPGPIMQLKEAIDEIGFGDSVEIVATDPGFASDVPAWCHATGNKLVEFSPASSGGYAATVLKRKRHGGEASSEGGAKRFTNVVFSNDLDKALAAFIIANGAASMGYEVTLFFTFWGLNILRRDGAQAPGKNLIERMFGFMMPKGPKKLALSKMHMGGMGAAMIRKIMKKKQVATLPELIESAKKNGVKLVACAMSMDLMGIKREELIEGVEEGGVAMYLDHVGRNGNLFI
jgi:NADPH-dependent 2,4-dienoyl-CoA reductase/sulfur reductase-like enzyme/peroxiredoxin family protein/TusA-related sulfurtransferase/rhodanese-related sulfurtransferase